MKTSSLLASLAFVTTVGCADGYSLDIVEYARSSNVPAERLSAGAQGELIDMSWYFLVARQGDRVVLFDAGTTWFERETNPPAFFKTYWKVDWHRSVTQSLAAVGVDPEDVTDVVASHHHFDHLEGIVELPNAHLWIPEGEWTDARAAYDADILVNAGLVPDPGPVFDQMEAQGRVHALGSAGAGTAFGAYPLWRFLDSTIAEGGKHTHHSSVASIRCSNDRVFHYAADAAYYYRNLEQGVAVGSTVDAAANVRDMAKLVESVGGIGNIGQIIPGHDPAVFSRFSIVGDRVARVCP